MKTSIVSLADTNIETVLDAFEAAFADYPVKFERNIIGRMLQRRGYSSRASYAAVDNGNIAAFALNGLDDYHGLPTVYDTGTGTLPAYRDSGLAKELLTYAINDLAMQGVRRFLLEVLSDNKPAISVYTGCGFSKKRMLHCHVNPQHSYRHERLAPAPRLVVRRSLELPSVVGHADFCDFESSWQNGIGSLRRAGSTLVSLLATDGDIPVGYLVADTLTGDVAQIAVHRDHRRRGVATRLMDTFVHLNRAPVIKVLNIDAGCDSLPSLLNALNLPLTSSQYEMEKLIV